MFKFWNENESFDMTTSHDFVPSEALIKEAVECSQTMTIYEDVEDVTEIGPLTKAMRECKHNRLWNFSKGFPSNIIGCCDCSYWRFID